MKGFSTRKPTNIELYYAGCGHNSPPCKACRSSYINGYRLILTATTTYNLFYI